MADNNSHCERQNASFSASFTLRLKNAEAIISGLGDQLNKSSDFTSFMKSNMETIWESLSAMIISFRSSKRSQKFCCPSFYNLSERLKTIFSSCVPINDAQLYFGFILLRHYFLERNLNGYFLLFYIITCMIQIRSACSTTTCTHIFGWYPNMIKELIDGIVFSFQLLQTQVYVSDGSVSGSSAFQRNALINFIHN